MVLNWVFFSKPGGALTHIRHFLLAFIITEDLNMLGARRGPRGLLPGCGCREIEKVPVGSKSL